MSRTRTILLNLDKKIHLPYLTENNLLINNLIYDSQFNFYNSHLNVTAAPGQNEMMKLYLTHIDVCAIKGCKDQIINILIKPTSRDIFLNSFRY